MRSIVLATRNPGKLREIRQVLSPLGIEIVGLDAFEHVEDPEERGTTFADNARQKAISYARATGEWCLADDSGLVVDALDGAPGVRSARYAADRVPLNASRDEIDATNNNKLLEELREVPPEQRTARFVCHLALSDGDQILLETSDTMNGHISLEPRGTHGFGYDPLFIINETNRTAAESTPDQKNQISHRGKAVRRFARMLSELLTSLP